MSHEVRICRQEGVMKALAVRLPFAWLMVQGHKDIENRTWPTHHRGPFFVHASKTYYKEEMEYFKAELAREGVDIPADLPRGGIVGVVTLVDCVERVDLSWWRQILCWLLRNRPNYCVDQPDSDWFEGPYGFILRDARPLPFVPWRGQQKFFNVPDDLYGPELMA